MRKTEDKGGRTKLPRRLQAMDIRALELLDRVYRTRNVSAACAELGLSQPAASRTLARLRDIYADALFVRQQRGVQPTPRADLLAPQIAAALSTLERTMITPGFESRTARRTFRVACSDIGERHFLPRLARHLAKAAPDVRLEIAAMPDLSAALASGAVDLAVGFLPALGKQVHIRCLFREKFVYVARRNHPRMRAPLEVRQLREVQHAIASPAGYSHTAVVEHVLASSRVRVPVAVRVRSFLSLGAIVAGSDLVAVIPSNLAKAFIEYLPLQVLEPPFHITGFDISVGWHQRFHRDPGNRWLRETWISVFGE
jgi:DNA-binding transcriptional LysR family regulator